MNRSDPEPKPKAAGRALLGILLELAHDILVRAMLSRKHQHLQPTRFMPNRDLALPNLALHPAKLTCAPDGIC
jgi:hypothetical protein